MIQNNLSPRSIVNRAYYTVFYSLLALFLKADINVKTSKHTGVIAVFDKEFVHTGKIDQHYSKIVHKIFEAVDQSRIYSGSQSYILQGLKNPPSPL